MSKKENKQVDDVSVTDSVADSDESRVTASYAAMPEERADKSKLGAYIAAFVVVAIIILGVLYFLEKEGRSSTNIFDSVIASQEANTVVARVNGEEIINSELNTSVQQFSQAAAAEGVDVASPDAQVEIRNQALDVLINTELLKQAAAERGITVSDEAAASRLATIETDIGGAEVLAERMQTLGITTDRLKSDIRDEIMIQELLDLIFQEAGITVTEEEIAEVYANAGEANADLPALEEVRPQIEAQIKASKEQEVIDKYLTELKAEAEIEIL